ncbi:MAG: hypothetical protein K6E22_04220 [Treponema sp.]|nr:hypothetical protein [Treponema sp.]
MERKFVFIFKFIIFCIGFYLLNLIFAFVLKNDSTSYTRIIFHELHQQKNIDVLICGASHVSHDFYPAQADKILGMNTFCSGTPSQPIDATYAVIQEAVSQCPVKHIFLEMDFAVANGVVFKNRDGLRTNYLVSEYLNNKKVKFNYLKDASAPNLYLNSLLPLGKEKFIDLNPISIVKNFRSKLTGQYYKYDYSSAENYVGKGCVMRTDIIENGTYYSDGEKPIAVKDIGDDYKNTVRKIVSFCEQNKIPLTFFAMPCSDFYLAEKGNYDEYYNFVKDFTASMGYEYYDFNLCKEEHLYLEDCDFWDDNHLAKTGIIKFTKAFCDFFYENNAYDDLAHKKSDWFYDSYSQKTNAQPERLYGLELKKSRASDGSAQIKIIPLINHGDSSTVAYEVSAELKDSKTIVIQQKSANDTISLPTNAEGKIKISAWFNGKCLNHVEEYFNTSL